MFEQHATLFFSVVALIAVAGGYCGSVLHRIVERKRSWISRD